MMEIRVSFTFFYGGSDHNAIGISRVGKSDNA